ncbi:MAG: succinate dehydrogenase, cytochrome b556 subunit [Elusimicrobia bacterium]|nr:succinate dehydrogenase, cytochrome b556 subunit [Elusimicrobiota bacterium]
MFYKGKEGQWSWIFHRITGIGVLLFLAIHIIDTMLVGWGPEIYNKVIAIYRNPIFKIGEVGLFAAVLYHALNGIRIMIIDFVPEFTKYHRQIFYLEMLLFFLSMIPVSFLMLSH